MGASSVCIWEHPFANGTGRGNFAPGLKKKVPFTNGTGFHLQMGGSHLQMGAICKRGVTSRLPIGSIRVTLMIADIGEYILLILQVTTNTVHSG